jgi:hypothetical protein
MGLSVLATNGSAFWKAPRLFVLIVDHHGKITRSDKRFESDIEQAIMLWAPYTTTNSQWIANKVLQGFFGAPIESLCEISVSDVV